MRFIDDPSLYGPDVGKNSLLFYRCKNKDFFKLTEDVVWNVFPFFVENEKILGRNDDGKLNFRVLRGTPNKVHSTSVSALVVRRKIGDGKCRRIKHRRIEVEFSF